MWLCPICVTNTDPAHDVLTLAKGVLRERSGRPWTSLAPSRGFQGSDVIQDLDQLHMTEVQQDGKRFLLRDEAQGTCGGVFQAAGVAPPQTVQQLAPLGIEEDDAQSATLLL